MEKAPYPLASILLIPEPYMVQEKELPNLISLFSNDHFLIYERCLLYSHEY